MQSGNVIYLGERTLQRGNLLQKMISSLISYHIKSTIERKVAFVRQLELIRSIIFRTPFDYEKITNYRHKVVMETVTNTWDKVYKIQCTIKRIKQKITSLITNLFDFLYEETEEVQLTIEDLEKEMKGKVIPITVATRLKNRKRF